MGLILTLVARRLVFAGLTLVLVAIIVFLAMEVLPGDIATRVLGRSPSPEAMAALRERFGLDRPALERFFAWGGGILTGDLGESMISGRRVAAILAGPLANTAALSLLALLLYLPIAFGVAALQVAWRGRSLDHILSVATLLVAAVPDFLLGTGLLLLFSLSLGWFPVRSLVEPGLGLIGWLEILALPALTLALVMAVYGVRMLRDNLIEAMEGEPVRAAILRGLGPRRVLLLYALPAALVPSINVTALNVSYLIGGVVVVEKVFSFPGFGSQTVDAFQQRDIPVIEATVLIAAGLFILVNLLADLLALALNPRLRAG